MARVFRERRFDKTIATWVSSEFRDFLKKKAQEQDITMGEIIRRLLEQAAAEHLGWKGKDKK